MVNNKKNHKYFDYQSKEVKNQQKMANLLQTIDRRIMKKDQNLENLTIFINTR